MQAQLKKVDLHTQNVESNFQLGLNNRLGMMSARLVEFQSDIGKKLETQFSNFCDDILGFR